MAEIEDENGNVCWYVELTCPVGHEVRAEGRLVRHKSGTRSFLVYNVERPCPYCGLEAEQKEKQRLVDEEARLEGWSVIGTGGGCEALFKPVSKDERTYYLVTLEDDPSLPVAGKPAKLGYFEDDDGEAKWTTRIDVYDGPASVWRAKKAFEAAQVGTGGA